MAEVEPQPPAEAGRAQGGQQGHRLRDDAGRGADGENEFGARGQLGGLAGTVVGHGDEQQPGADDHHVVEHRSPHGSGEPVADVQDRPDRGAETVEDDLRQEEPGEGGCQPGLLGGETAGIDVHDQRGGDDSERRGAAQDDEDQRDQPLRVGLPAVEVGVGRLR